MKFILLFITLNAIFTLNTFSQTKKSDKFLAHESPRNYDVTKYDLQVDWVDILPSTKHEPEKRQWNSKLTITLTPLENNFSLVELDAVKLKINEIWVNGNEVTNIPNNSNGILAIPVPTMHIGDTVSILLNYTYNNPYNIGFFHRNSLDTYPENIENGVNIPIAGTLSEPQDARYWLPCNDQPSDKALVSIAVTVPTGMLAASNGRLDSTKTNYENNTPYSETFYWTSSHPMPPYLMTIAASEYKLNIEKTPVSSTNTDSIDVYYYTWNDDWKGNATHNLSRFAATTPKTMQIFGDLFGSYPFEKYGVAVLDYTLLGANSLGMEHQTLTTISRSWLENHIPIPEFPSFAHELAHSWFGNMVTCHTWKDIWFNEGGASWLEAIYIENIKGHVDTAAYYNQMKNNRYSYLRNKENTYELSLYLDDNIEPFWYTSLVYSKASWVFHHLRMLLGNNVFALLKQMLEQHKFGTITSQDFVDFFVNNVQNPPNNVDMKRFLEQFIFQAGHPIYNINTSVTKLNDNYNVSVLLEQTQNANNVPNEFLMNLNILFFDKDNNIIHSEFIINDSRQQAYSFDFPVAPAKVILDTTKALLEINKNTLLDDIWDGTNYNDILIYPNPTNTGQLAIQFNSDISINWSQQLEIIDILSNRYYVDIIQMNGNTISIDISKLAVGIYFIKVNGLKMYKIAKI